MEPLQIVADGAEWIEYSEDYFVIEQVVRAELMKDKKWDSMRGSLLGQIRMRFRVELEVRKRMEECAPLEALYSCSHGLTAEKD